MNAAILLFWIGIALEGLGFMLAWRDLNLEASAFDRFTRRPVTVRPDVIRGTTLFPPGVLSVEGPKPTLEERVAALQSQMTRKHNEIALQLEKQETEFKERLDHVSSSLRAHYDEELAALARIVQSVHEDRSSRRQAIVLFVTGAVLSGASQVAQ